MPDDKNHQLEKQLFQILQNFSLPELRDLCYDLGIVWDNLPYRKRINDAAREIVNYFANRNQLDKLENELVKKRPNLFKSPEDISPHTSDGIQDPKKQPPASIPQPAVAPPEGYRIRSLHLLIITLVIGVPLLVWGITSCRSFNYQVRIEDKETGEPIFNADVELEVAGIPSLTGITGSNGRASIQVPPNYANQTGRLIVRADGYEAEKKEVVLTDESLPTVIRLDSLAESEPTVISTPTPTSTHTPTATSTYTKQPPTATPTANPTSTHTATTTSTPSSTPTLTPTHTRVPLIPTATPIPPQLIAPIGSTLKNPIEFSWTGSTTVLYQVVLRNSEREYEHVSGWIQGNIWLFNIPEDKFGGIEWFVVSDAGAQSESETFFFQPYGGGGSDGGNGDPTSTPPP